MADHAERLIDRLRKDIPLYDLARADEKTIAFSVCERDKKKVIEEAKALSVSLRIQKESGFPLVLSHLKKRPGLWLGALFAACIIAFSSQIIWEVNVTGNEHVPERDIIRTLGALGIREGAFIRKDVLDRMYLDFLLKENRIAWISVNFDGTIARVEVDEVKEHPAREDKTKPVNIVAACDGIVKRIDALDGQKEAQTGEAVVKGQLLISSFFQTPLSGTVFRCARGSVWAQTERTYAVVIPKRREIPVLEETAYSVPSVRILGIRIPLGIGRMSDGELFRTEFTSRQACLLENVRLPFYIETESRRVCRYHTENVTHEQASARASALLKAYLSDISDEAEIIGVRESETETDADYIFEYRLECLENIAKEVPFEME